MIVAGTTPYPWPFDQVVDPARTALVVCGADQQWADRTPADPDRLASLDRLRAGLAAAGVLEVVLHHDNPSGRRFVAPVDAVGAAVVPSSSASLTVRSAGIDGFYGSDLDPLLRRHGRSHLLLAGLGLETTVHSTMRRANDRGYECLLVADATLAIDDRLRAASVSSIEMSGGIFGAVGGTNAVLTAFGVGS